MMFATKRKDSPQTDCRCRDLHNVRCFLTVVAFD
jgi:hypothetical protein